MEEFRCEWDDEGVYFYQVGTRQVPAIRYQVGTRQVPDTRYQVDTSLVPATKYQVVTRQVGTSQPIAPSININIIKFLSTNILDWILREVTNESPPRLTVMK